MSPDLVNNSKGMRCLSMILLGGGGGGGGVHP